MSLFSHMKSFRCPLNVHLRGIPFRTPESVQNSSLTGLLNIPLKCRDYGAGGGVLSACERREAFFTSVAQSFFDDVNAKHLLR